MNQQFSPNSDPAVQDSVLMLLRSSLWGQERFPLEALPGTDWSAVYQELCHQTVQHLCVDALAAADPQNTLRYIQAASGNIRKWYHLMARQQELCAMLADAGIPCAVLKGAAADIHYPNPANRNMGDIDLIVRPEDFDRASQIMQSRLEPIHVGLRHTEYKGMGVLVELHRKFSAFRSPQMCSFLDDLVFDGICRAETGQIEKFTFPMLPRLENGLVLITHINSHMERGLGMRQMIDWMLYVDRELDDEFWNTQFAPAVRRLGLEKLALTVTRMCQIYLGLRDDITWCRDADAELCSELIDHTFRQGNFGRKLPYNINVAVGVFSTAKNIPGFFREMQQRGLFNWTAAQKYRLLRPFAWLYQIFRYIRLGLKQKHPIRYLAQALSSEKKQGSLLDRLEVSRMSNDH